MDARDKLSVEVGILLDPADHRVVELQKFRRSQEEICHEHGRRDVTDDWYENETGWFLF